MTSKKRRPLVLLTNDDGYDAAGLEAMASTLARHAEVIGIAPESQQSACSHALSLHRPMRLRKVREHLYALDGTPADCVYVGLLAGDRILPRWPDVVVSGLNLGPNLGHDIYYSGTVAGAREAAIRGVTGVAVSTHPHADLGVAARICGCVVMAVIDLSQRMAAPFVLNVNVPSSADGSKFRATRPGRRTYGEGVDFRLDPRGREYLWIGGTGVYHQAERGTDTYAFDRDEVSISWLPLASPVEKVDDIAATVVRCLRRRGPSRNMP